MHNRVVIKIKNSKGGYTHRRLHNFCKDMGDSGNRRDEISIFSDIGLYVYMPSIYTIKDMIDFIELKKDLDGGIINNICTEYIDNHGLHSWDYELYSNKTHMSIELMQAYQLIAKCTASICILWLGGTYDIIGYMAPNDELGTGIEVVVDNRKFDMQDTINKMNTLGVVNKRNLRGTPNLDMTYYPKSYYDSEGVMFKMQLIDL